MSMLPRNNDPFLTRMLIDAGNFDSRIFLVDVGARRGIDERWEAISSAIEGLGFELDKGECERLNSDSSNNFTYVPSALFSRNGSQNLYDRKCRDASGLVSFPDFYKRFATGEAVEVLNNVEIECTTFDSVWMKMNKPKVEFFKIDAEGAETHILKGAETFLAQNELLGAEIETRFFHFGEQGRFNDIFSCMTGHGLHFFDVGLVRHTRKSFPDIEEISGTKNYPKWTSGAQVIASDVLFLRDFVHEKQCGRVFTEKDLTSIVKMVVIFESYELYDCIAEILLSFSELLEEFGINTEALLNSIASNKSQFETYDEYMRFAAQESVL